MTDNAAANTDRELWREREGDYYANSIHVTQDGGIGMNVGGCVIVMPIFEWHALATGATSVQPLLGVEHEDVARDALTKIRSMFADLVDESGRTTSERHADRALAREVCEIADAVLALPHTGQSQEGITADELRELTMLADGMGFGRTHNALRKLLTLSAPAPQAGCAKEGEARADIERHLWAAIDLMAATLVKPDERVWSHLFVYAPTENEICAACGEHKREHAPGGTRWGPTSLCGVFIPASPPPPVAESG